MFSDSDLEEWSDWVRRKAKIVSASARHVLGDLDRKLPNYLPPLNTLVNEHGGFNESLLKEELSLEDLEYLLKTRCVDPNYNERGWNALSVACRLRIDQQQERLALLLQHKVPVNHQAVDYHDYTPLHFLIEDENKEVALFFIQQAKRTGMFIHFSLAARDGSTTLLLASKKGLEEVALCILEHSTAPEVFMNLWDDQNKTVFDYASSLGQARLLEKLSGLGARSGAMLADSSQVPLCTFIFEMSRTQKIDQSSASPIDSSKVTMAGQVITFVEAYKPKSPRV